MALHSSRYVRDTLEHNPDSMFQLRLDEVQVFNRMGVESKRRLSFPSRLADIRESAWQQEQARMRQGRDRDDGWRRIQVCVEESGSDEEDSSGGTGRGGANGNEKRTGDRLPSNQIPERGRSYKSHQIQRPSSSAYQEHGMRSDSGFHHGQRMASGSSAYREHGMTKPPALFSYHNVQKKSCLVEESAESETEEEEERELYEEEKCELFESEDEESEENGEEEEKEVRGRRKMSPNSSVKSLQAEARRRFSVGDPCFQFPSQPYVESPATLYIQPEDRLNYILEEEETEDEEEEEGGGGRHSEEEERITFTIEEEEEEEEDCERFPVLECDTPSYTVEEEEEEERVIPILIEEEEEGKNSWRLDQNFSHKEKSAAGETEPHVSLTRQERAAAIGEIVRSQQREVGARLRRNTREESVSAIGDLIKDLSAELEQLKQNRRVLESLRRNSTSEAPPVISKPPKGQNSGSRLMMGELRRRKPPRPEFTTYADLLETMCTASPSATAHQQSPSRRHSSVVLPTASSLLRAESKTSQPKRFSTAGGSLLSSSACRVVKEKEEPVVARETYSCDQLVTITKSLSCNSLDSLVSESSHSPPSSISPSMSYESESMTDLGSEQSSESELMSDPSSCDELWLLPQQVLAMDVDLLQAELPLSRSSTEDLRPEDLRFARASPSKSTFWMYSVVQGRLRSC